MALLRRFWPTDRSLTVLLQLGLVIFVIQPLGDLGVGGRLLIGDITAVHPVARSLVTFDALTGQLFLAILLARLVSMELFYHQAQRAERR